MPNFEKRITGGQAVQDVMRIQGLTPPSPVVGTSDQTALQLWVLATQVGQQLLKKNDWQFLLREHNITTVPGTLNYALPSDFESYITDSQWDRTSQYPIRGNLQQHEWQALKASTFTGASLVLLFTIMDDEVLFLDIPSSAHELYLPYKSRSWVVEAGGTEKDNLTVDNDIVKYDGQMFKQALKLAWKAEKGFDVTREQAAFDEMLEDTKSQNAPARTLSLDPRRGFPYLGYRNIPETGYGS